MSGEPSRAAEADSVDPPVSILLPTLDERRYLRDCLDSLLAQDYPNVTEILVLDGGSTDGTTTLAERLDGRVRVVPNPGITAAAAMNLGLQEAANDLVVRADAHTLYAPDYVRQSVRVRRESAASWVGGPMRPVGLTSFGRAVAAVTSSPFGVGPGRFHYGTVAQDVDTVYLGTFDRRDVWNVGGYDDVQLQWAAEDQELNYRLRRAGHRIRMDPSIVSWYFPRQGPGALARQYFNYGLCKASTLQKHRTLPTWRPVAPGALVGGVVGWAAVAAARRRPEWSVAPVIVYVLGAAAVGTALARDPGVAPHRAAAAVATCHWAYGFGLWSGLARIVRQRPFDSRPAGRR